MSTTAGEAPVAPANRDANERMRSADADYAADEMSAPEPADGLSARYRR